MIACFELANVGGKLRFSCTVDAIEVSCKCHNGGVFGTSVQNEVVHVSAKGCACSGEVYARCLLLSCCAAKFGQIQFVGHLLGAGINKRIFEFGRLSVDVDVAFQYVFEADDFVCGDVKTNSILFVGQETRVVAEVVVAVAIIYVIVVVESAHHLNGIVVLRNLYFDLVNVTVQNVVFNGDIQTIQLVAAFVYAQVASCIKVVVVYVVLVGIFTANFAITTVLVFRIGVSNAVYIGVDANKMLVTLVFGSI